MLSFNGVELAIGQRVIIVEDDDCYNNFTYGIIRVIYTQSGVVHIDVPCDDYGRDRIAEDVIVLQEDNK